MAYLEHLVSDNDLVTSYAAIRAGFVSLALEKNRRATPFITQARALQSAALRAQTPTHLLSLKEIQVGILTAAGVSDKAAKHLQEADKAEAILGLINNFLEPAGEHFVEELVFRYLLIRGDTLGGTMRNLGGMLAQQKLTRSLLATLSLAGYVCQWLDAKANTWAIATSNEPEIEVLARGLSWQRGAQSRTLVYNLTVPIVGNNIDLCLLDCASSELASPVYQQPNRYLALGELKGGIDPAGADEHWKTAHSALQRIRTAFAKTDWHPHTFFVGAAIEKKMAAEIWQQLTAGELTNAANLTEDKQLFSLAHWLVSI